MDVYFLVYVMAAVIGSWLYNYAGYLKFGKPLNEKYDWSKWFETMLKGGGLSAVINVVLSIYSGSDFNYLILVNSFIDGAGLSAGLNEIKNVISPKKSDAENIVDTAKVLSDLSDAFKKFASSVDGSTATSPVSQANTPAVTEATLGAKDSPPTVQNTPAAT